MKNLRLFISSPGDVGREREATRRVIDRLQSEFAEHVTLDPYFWEWEPVDFGQDYQSQIPSTADFDIVICLLWSKLGSRLGDQYKLPPDRTETASSGTQYELMQALHGKQQHPEKLPDLLVWVNKAPSPPASSPPLSRDQEDELIRQRRALQDFLATITRDTSTGIFTAAVNRYEVPSEDLGSYTYLDEFEDMMDKKLRKLIEKHIGQRTVKPKPQWPGSPFRDLDVFEFEHAPIFFGRSRAVGEVVRLLQSTLSKPQPCHFALILGASGSGKSSLARAGVLPLLTRPGVIEGIGLWRCAIVRPSDDSADLFQALASALLNSDRKIEDKKIGSDFSVSNFSVAKHQPPALPELADPESSDAQKSLATELRAHPETVAIRVKDQLSAVAKAHQTQQRHTLEAQIASLTQEGRQADAALKQQALQNLQEPKARLVLLLDQMEELFTLNYAPEQLRAFLETIDVLARSGRVFVIGTLRSDFYPRYQEQPTLVTLARDGARFDLLPPTPDEISQIIRRPASLAALQFEPHPTTAEHTLADTLRDEALADTETLPLLEHVLNRLYQAQLTRADGRLTFADYEDICGVDVDPKTGIKTSRGVGGALGKHAEDIFTGQNLKPTDPPPPWTEDTFRAVFRCLVTFGKGEGDTDVPNRRAFTYQDLIQSHPAAQALVDTFIHERLLIADTDAQSRPIVRLSHEALLTRWPRLANWLQTAPVRDLMSQRRRLESSLRQWQEQNRTSDCYLQPGFELEEGKQLLEKHEAALTRDEREFITVSVSHHLAENLQRGRIKRLIIGTLSLLTLVAIVGAVYGLISARNAARKRDEAQFNEGLGWMLRAQVAEERKNQYPGTLLYAANAIGFDGVGHPTNSADDILVLNNKSPLGEIHSDETSTSRILRYIRRERNPDEYDAAQKWIGERPAYLPIWASVRRKSTVTGLGVSSSGRWLALGWANGAVSLWDFESQTETEVLPPGEPVNDIAFHPLEQQMSIATASRIWQWPLPLGSGSVVELPLTAIRLAWSPGGTLLAAAAADGNIHFWQDGNLSTLSTGQSLPVTTLSYAADNSTLVAAVPGYGIHVSFPQSKAFAYAWRQLAAEEIEGIDGDDKKAQFLAWAQAAGRSTAAAISPDGQLLAVGDQNGGIGLWSTSRAELLGQASQEQRHQGAVHSLSFRPDGIQFASASEDGTVRLWEVKESVPLIVATLTGHIGAVTHITYAPGGKLLATAGIDGSARLWDVTGRRATAIDLYSYMTENWFRFDDKDQQALVWAGGSGSLNVPANSLLGIWHAGGENAFTTLFNAKEWAGALATVPEASKSPLATALLAEAQAAAKAHQWNTVDLRLCQYERVGVQAEAAALRKRQATLAQQGQPFTTPTGLSLLWCPPGNFMMGSPETEKGRYPKDREKQHNVTISRGFWLGQYEITQAQWKALMGNNPSTQKAAGLLAPVENVTWHEAMAFCRRLTDRERACGTIPVGWEYSLPTEAEWEYACRAGTIEAYSFGNEVSNLHLYGNFNDKNGITFTNPDYSQDDGYEFTAPVGTYRPNPWGFYDMHGNVWEWCLDAMDETNPDFSGEPVFDPIGNRGKHRVNRGGGYRGIAGDCRSAFRKGIEPGNRYNSLGFRPALVIKRQIGE